MCNYRTLYYSDKYGYVIFCELCRHLQLGFGCVLINFQRDEFNSFRRVVREIIEDYEGMELSGSKSITIPTPCEGLSLFLSPVEINVLHDVLEQADTNLSVTELMNLF